MRISKPRIGVRVKIIAGFAVLIGFAFFIVMTLVMRITTEYLIDQRVREELTRADSLAMEIAPYLSSSDADGLYNLLVSSGRETGVRVLVLGTQATVLSDGHASLTGASLRHGEVLDILAGLRDRSYGFHLLQTDAGQEWVGYFTSVITYDAQRIGVLMVSSSIQGLMDRLGQMRSTLILYFTLTIAAVIYAGWAVAGIITRPINSLTQVIGKTSRGDFSARVEAKGSDELARLGRTFNMMSERLESQERMRNDFISNASHELKTPLSAMKILIESLIHQKQFDPEITRDFLTDVNSEIDRLNRIVTDLLVLVRFDSAAMEFSAESIALMSLLADTAQRLAPVARQAGIELSVIPRQELLVSGDRNRLQQVFYNLMDNAIKYTQAGGRVRVEVLRNGPDVTVNIQDTGIGISEEDQKHIFDRFYRVDKARSRATGGTGLGLSIAKNIAVMHGGDIQVSSKEGAGTTFAVILPLETEKLPEGQGGKRG